jgi:hypothetical protein
MGAMRRITKDDDIVAPREVEELRGIMGAVSVHEEDSSLASSFVFSLPIKIFDHPFKC